MLGGLARIQLAVAGHWLLGLNALMGAYVGLAVFSPLLLMAGYEGFGRGIFEVYRFACHQEPERSFFIGGYQMAFCQRDVAIYGTMFVAGLGFVLVRGRLRPLTWWLYPILLIPIALDGGTQLIGWRESTVELRVSTGALFGLANVWLLYPHIERGMREWKEEILGGRAALARTSRREDAWE